MDKKLALTGTLKAAAPPTPEFIMGISGYASTGGVDRTNDIVEPSAFEGTMTDYLKNPVIMFNHDWSRTPIGKTTSYRIDDKGLFIDGAIVDTESGREIKALIEAGILNSFSIGFNIKKWERSVNEGDPFRITELDLIEISIVSSPANLEAVITQAEAKGIHIKSLRSPEGGDSKKGIFIMEDLQKKIDESVAPVTQKVEAAEVKVADVGSKVDKINTIISELKQASANGEKTSGELRALIDKASGDFVAAKDVLDKEIAAIKARRTTTSNVSLQGRSLKSMMELEPREIRAAMPSNDAEQIVAFQKKTSDLVLIDSLLEASSKKNNGSYHEQNRKVRIKSLNAYKEWDNFRKAMDTETASEGTEWIPTVMSGDMIELVRIELKVASLFDEISMPSPTFTIDAEGADTIATLAAQTTAVVSAFNTTEQTPGTGSITLTAQKLRGRYQVSTEMTEDSAVAVMPFARSKLVRSIARGEDRAIINADNTSGSHFDTGYTVGATDARKAWDGLRYHWNTNVGIAKGVDLGTFNLANWNKVRGAMGKYGLYPSELVNIVSIATYLYRLMNPDEFPQFQTLEKYGPAAVILTGEVGRVNNIPVIVSEFIDDTMGTDGIYDNSTATDRTASILVNHRSWLRGVRRMVEVKVVEDPLNDVYQLVCHKRCDFQPTTTPSSSNVTVNCGYNIATT